MICITDIRGAPQVMERGEKIESLIDKTSMLKSEASSFRSVRSPSSILLSEVGMCVCMNMCEYVCVCVYVCVYCVVLCCVGVCVCVCVCMYICVCVCVVCVCVL